MKNSLKIICNYICHLDNLVGIFFFFSNDAPHETFWVSSRRLNHWGAKSM
jgi:hypothetical protein